jgi:hypothetical protein
LCLKLGDRSFLLEFDPVHYLVIIFFGAILCSTGGVFKYNKESKCEAVKIFGAGFAVIRVEWNTSLVLKNSEFLDFYTLN